MVAELRAPDGLPEHVHCLGFHTCGLFSSPTNAKTGNNMSPKAVTATGAWGLHAHRGRFQLVAADVVIEQYFHVNGLVAAHESLQILLSQRVGHKG